MHAEKNCDIENGDIDFDWNLLKIDQKIPILVRKKGPSLKADIFVIKQPITISSYEILS